MQNPNVMTLEHLSSIGSQHHFSVGSSPLKSCKYVQGVPINMGIQ